MAQWYPQVVRLACIPWTSAQYRCLGDGPGYFRRRLSRSAAENAERSFAHGTRQCGALVGALWGRFRPAADCRSLATRPRKRAPVGKGDGHSDCGTAIHQGGVIAKLQADGQSVEVRAPISGPLRDLYVQPGQTVTPGTEIAVVEPGDDQVWEALRGLYVVGQTEDLAAILPYERDVPENSDRVREQATLTEQAIRARAR